jgi:hypothetical protein
MTGDALPPLKTYKVSPIKRARASKAQVEERRSALFENAKICAELIADDSCSALGITARGTAPVLTLCRQLIEAGHDPATPLEAWRGDVLCLRIRSIGEGVALRIGTHGVGFERLPECTAASPMRKNAARLGVPRRRPVGQVQR